MNELKPEAMYERTNMYEIRKISYGTVVIGVATKFDVKRREVEVDLGYPWTGIIPENEVSVNDFTFSEGAFTPHQISSIIGKKIRAIVTEVLGPHKVLLSRRISLIDTWETLQEGQELVGQILNNVGYGIFIDIGNGLSTYLHKKECSTTRMQNTRNWFKKNETVKIKLINKGTEPGQKIICSRILAYPEMKNIEEPYNVGDIIAVRISYPVPEGYFCEITPRIYGIIDVPEMIKVSDGDTIKAVIKRIFPTEKGDGIHLKYLK